MTIKRRFVPRDSSSEESDDDARVRLPRASFRREATHDVTTDVIMIGDSDLSDSDIDIISIECVERRRKANDVWRNIIECDLLDERIKCIGLESVMVHRDTESYELPAFKIHKPKRMKFNQGRNVKERLGSRKSQTLNNVHTRQRRRSRSRSRQINEDHIICLSTSDDEVEIIAVEQTKKVKCKNESIRATTLVDSEINSSSEDDDQEKYKLNSWSKLMEHLHNNKYQIEFDDGRRRAAMRIAGELQESKVDLIDRCLIYLGVEKCLVFLDATKKIEACGGMPTKDGSRRRTPGGVFLTMIKSDRTIDDVIKEQIFLDSENQFEENAILWWKSLETFQYKRSAQFRGVANYARKKEFKSYTLLDLDYFESIREFRYRYIPIMTNFPLRELRRHVADISEGVHDDDVFISTQVDPPALPQTLIQGHAAPHLLDCGV